MNCDDLPRSGPNPYDIGLPAALEAAERRELTLGGLGTALNWADREPRPEYIPILKRLVVEYRCANLDAEVALAAIESAGEPVDYFMDVAANWAFNDLLSASAMNALGIRGDSSVYAPLREIALGAPRRGRFGTEFQSAFNSYLGGIAFWGRLRAQPVGEQIVAGAYSTLQAIRGPVLFTARGDSVSQLENYNGSNAAAIPRRMLREVARVYPTATEAALVAFQDTARAHLLRRGVEPRHIPLYEPLVVRNGRETAFPLSGPPLPQVVESAQIAVSACAEARPDLVYVLRGVPGLAAEPRLAVFSYVSAEPGPVRIAYGPDNALAGQPDASVPPEVFSPPGQAGRLGTAFRVPVPAGKAVSWTLLGQTVTVDASTPLCNAR